MGARVIQCNHCGGNLLVSERAISISCRYCHQRVGVEDRIIDHYHAGTNIETAGSLVITAEGHVRARLSVKNLEIQGHGQVYGNVTACGKVRVDAYAHLLGDVTAQRLEVHPGARLRGFYRIGLHEVPTLLPPPHPDPIEPPLKSSLQDEDES